MYLKDDIEYSKDDFYKLSLYFIEDVEINDDIVQYEDGHSIVQYSMSIGRLTGHSIKSQRNVRQIFKHIHAQMQQRDRSGDRQPARGDRVVPHNEEGYGADARGTPDQHSEREQSVREQEHIAAWSRIRGFAKMSSEPGIPRYPRFAKLPPV